MIKSIHFSVLLAAFTFLPGVGLAITDGTETFSVPDAELLTDALASPGNPVTVTDVQGWDFTAFAENTPTNTRFDLWDGAVLSGNGVAFSESDFGSDHYFSAIRITPTDGSFFDLDSIGLNLQLWDGGAVVNDQDVTLYGLDDTGAMIVGATLTLAVNDGELTLFDTSANAAFDQIAGLMFAPSSTDYVMSYGFIDNIAVSNVSVSVIPEPASLAGLAGMFALGLAGLRRRRS
ncbi:MAG: PEP-CTERM sorting domain-containing protein [Verrucomicrobiota bacterium]